MIPEKATVSVIRQGSALPKGESYDVSDTQSSSVLLIPKPSGSAEDPLNWPLRKKFLLLFTLCFAACAATLAPPAGQLAFVAQTILYDKSATSLSYAIAAAVAGLLAGPIVFVPVASIIGRTSTIFWSLVAVFLCQVWAASLTGPGDYNSFIASRIMCGLFAGAPTILGSGFIMDIFFLHQRGKAFACYELSLLLGVICSPTVGGFIAQQSPWPVVFWWTLAPVGAAAILVCLVCEETRFARNEDDTIYPTLPEGFVRNRILTLLPGVSVTPHSTGRDIVQRFIEPFLIAITPVCIIPGLYTFVAFGFTVLLAVELAIVLQTPLEVGGYGFSPYQNAAFTFVSWITVIAAQLISLLMSDRLPLKIAKRRGGHWQPEYRLYNMWLPIVIAPIGLAIVAVGLQYHLHYMVLALGSLFVGTAAQLSVPLLINYVVECFISRPIEVAVAMNTYRLAFGLALEFFYEPWTEAVGVGWTFGMAAIFTLLAGGLVVILIRRGQAFRRVAFSSTVSSSEDGMRCFGTGAETEGSKA